MQMLDGCQGLRAMVGDKAPLVASRGSNFKDGSCPQPSNDSTLIERPHSGGRELRLWAGVTGIKMDGRQVQNKLVIRELMHTLNKSSGRS